MRSFTCHTILLWLFLGFIDTATAQPYARVTSEEAQIYSRPHAGESAMRFNVQQGDTFDIIESQEEWIQINLFSGEARYIRSETVRIVFESKPFPSDPTVRRKICEEFWEAGKKASQKALSAYPRDVEKEHSYRNILFDTYLLDIFRAFDIPATHYSKLVECSKDGFMNRNIY